MFLTDLYKDDGTYFPKLFKESGTFGATYPFWKEHLFERVMTLFVWENTEDGNPNYSIKPKEIEQRLLLDGKCGIAQISAKTGNYTINNKLTALYGTFNGVTEYIDEFTKFVTHCPISTKTFTIGKNICVIDNSSLRNSILPLIHHYAILLAHADVSIITSLINLRDSGGVPIVTTEQQKQSVTEYQNKLFNGQYGTVTDKAMLGIEYGGQNKGNATDLKSLMEVRERLLKSFYQAIGVRSSFEKNNNAVESEITSDSGLLQLNLHDMLECRKRGCEEVNKMFGTNWSVKIAPEIDYMLIEETNTKGVDEDDNSERDL